MNLPNLDTESNATSATCIMKLITLQKTHILFHISYQVVHIILSYATIPWDYGHDIRTSPNEGSTYRTSTKYPSLANTKYASFIHTYSIWFHSWDSVNTSYTFDVVYDFDLVRCAMTKNNLISFLRSTWPLDYPILTPLVLLFLLCPSFKDNLIHSVGTLTLTDIDHMSIMNSSVMKPHTEMRLNHRPKWPKKKTRIHGNWTLRDLHVSIIGLKTTRYKENHTPHAGQSHLMRFTWTSAFIETTHHCS